VPFHLLIRSYICNVKINLESFESETTANAQGIPDQRFALRYYWLWKKTNLNDVSFGLLEKKKIIFLKLKWRCSPARPDRSRRTEIRWWCSTRIWLREFALANSATRYARSQIASLQGLWQRLGKLSILFNSGQPIGGSRSVVVAATVSLALDKWRGSEVFQTRTWRH
jgi:hypothetical protein